TRTGSWAVASPVTITNPGTQASNEGDAVSLQMLDGVPCTSLDWSATGLPFGLAIRPTDGLITGTVAYGAAAGGPYTVTVGGLSTSFIHAISFTWGVSSALALSPL